MSTPEVFLKQLELGTGEVVDMYLRGFLVPAGSGSTGTLQCTGLTTWRVADLTTRFMVERAHGFKGRRVLELGCGLGLCGLLAAKLVEDDGNVVLTDGDAEVLDLCEENLSVNGFSDRAITSLLRWGDADAAATLLQTHCGVDKDAGFDMIIGSDCLYGRNDEVVEALFSTVGCLLAGPRSTKCVKETKSGDEVLAVTSDGNGWVETDGGKVPETELGPVFVLGYERRVGGGSPSMARVLRVAAEQGFSWTIAEDCVLDMFQNPGSELSMFWEQCVFIFTRKRKS